MWLCVVVSVKAQSATQCTSPTLTSQIDADRVASACPTVTGDMIITSTNNTLSIEGIEVIDGSLLLDGSNTSSLTEFSSRTIKTVNGSFSIKDSPRLGSIDFPNLDYINEVFLLESLPNLDHANFHGLTDVGSFNCTAIGAEYSEGISHNISRLHGPNASFTISKSQMYQYNSALEDWTFDFTISSFIFTDNRFPTSLNLSQMNVSDTIHIAGNENVNSITMPDSLLPYMDTIILSGNDGGDGSYSNWPLNIVYHDSEQLWPWGIKSIRYMQIDGFSLIDKTSTHETTLNTSFLYVSFRTDTILVNMSELPPAQNPLLY